VSLPGWAGGAFFDGTIWYSVIPIMMYSHLVTSMYACMLIPWVFARFEIGLVSHMIHA